MAHASQRNQSPARAGGEWWFLTRPACRTRSVAGGHRLSPEVVGAPACLYRLEVGRLWRSCSRRALTVGHDPCPTRRPPARVLPRSRPFGPPAPGRWCRKAHQAPPTPAITPATEPPPAFVAVLPLRAGAPNPADYGGPELAAQQRAGYPDLGPLTLQAPPQQVFERALLAARA